MAWQIISTSWGMANYWEHFWHEKLFGRFWHKKLFGTCFGIANCSTNLWNGKILGTSSGMAKLLGLWNKKK